MFQIFVFITNKYLNNFEVKKEKIFNSVSENCNNKSSERGRGVFESRNHHEKLKMLLLELKSHILNIFCSYL